MSIALRMMSTNDYKKYLSDATKDYAEDKIAAGTWEKTEALQRAKESFESLLPAGKDTPEEYLYTIVDEQLDEKVGFLWVHLNKGKSISSFFIYDFIIFEPFRNLGYGKQTLACIEKIGKEFGVSKIDLHVFAHNKGAIHLYEKAGFIPTDISMSKQI